MTKRHNGYSMHDADCRFNPQPNAGETKIDVPDIYVRVFGTGRASLKYTICSSGGAETTCDCIGDVVAILRGRGYSTSPLQNDKPIGRRGVKCGLDPERDRSHNPFSWKEESERCKLQTKESDNE